MSCAIDTNDRPSQCMTEQDKTVFVLKDRGTGRIAHVKVCSRKCQQIQIDGALNEISPWKCDWCLRDKANGECLFVELKGSDCVHAVEQLICTIVWFKKNITPFLLYKDTFVVARSGIPGATSQLQRKMMGMASKHNTTIRIKHSPADISFEG